MMYAPAVTAARMVHRALPTLNSVPSLGGLDLNFARSGIGRMAKRNFAAQSLFSREFKLMGRRVN